VGISPEISGWGVEIRQGEKKTGKEKHRGRKGQSKEIQK
jgi:hypothetical protein